MNLKKIEINFNSPLYMRDFLLELKSGLEQASVEYTLKESVKFPNLMFLYVEPNLTQTIINVLNDALENKEFVFQQHIPVVVPDWFSEIKIYESEISDVEIKKEPILQKMFKTLNELSNELL